MLLAYAASIVILIPLDSTLIEKLFFVCVLSIAGVENREWELGK